MGSVRPGASLQVASPCAWSILKNQALEQHTSHDHGLNGHGENLGIPVSPVKLEAAGCTAAEPLLPGGSAFHQPVEQDVVPCLCFYGITLPAGSHPTAPTG